MKKSKLIPWLLASSILALAACGGSQTSSGAVSDSKQSSATPSSSTVVSSSSSVTKIALAAPLVTLKNFTASWAAVTDATSYELYLNSALLKSVSELTYDFDTTISTEQTLYVIAKGDAEKTTASQASNTIHFTAPSSLNAPVITLDSAGKKISWTASEHALSYFVFKNGEYLSEVTALEFAITDTDVGAYSFSVKAKYGDLLSDYSNAVVYKVLPTTIATATSWDRSGLYGDDWIRNGSFDTGVGEGCDMKAGSSMLMAHQITDDVKLMKVSMRVFHRDGETYPKFYVYVDGVVVKANDQTTDYVTTDKDAGDTFVYDLSAKIGETVIIEFKETASTHTCLTAVSMVKQLGAALSTTLDYDRSALFNEWFMTGTINSGVGEGMDLTSNGAAEVKHAITAETKYLNVKARQFSGQDTNKGHLQLSVDGTVLNTSEGAAYAVLTPLDDFESIYCWDLTAYVGKTVTLKLASVNDTNHCVVMRVVLTAVDASNLAGYGTALASANSWTGATIASDAALLKSAGGVGRNEGYDIKGGESITIRKTLAATTGYLSITARMYAGQDTSKAALKVTANDGNEATIKAVNSDFDTMPVPVSDSEAIYTYKLVDYAELTPVVIISNAESSTNHLVITGIEFRADDNHTAADNRNTYTTDFDRAALYAKWTVSGANSGVGEGVDLQGAGTMSYDFEVKETSKLMNVTTRMFVGQDTTAATLKVTVGGTIVRAVGATADDLAIALSDDDKVMTYDLSASVGSTVSIVIASSTSGINHCVVRHITFNATDGHTWPVAS